MDERFEITDLIVIITIFINNSTGKATRLAQRSHDHIKKAEI